MFFVPPEDPHASVLTHRCFTRLQNGQTVTSYELVQDAYAESNDGSSIPGKPLNMSWALDRHVGQNGSINMAFRIIPKLYASFGFNERTYIGYDLIYLKPMIGDENQYSYQRLEGEGGLNDAYLGLAYQFGKLSVGVNAVLLFGKLEERETISRIAYIDGMFDQSGYYIRTRTTP